LSLDSFWQVGKNVDDPPSVARGDTGEAGEAKRRGQRHLDVDVKPPDTLVNLQLVRCFTILRLLGGHGRFPPEFAAASSR
jgi:hypothetical protein